MEGAFTHVGNHLISDSAAAINAGDDLSTIDADEALLYGQYAGAGGLGGSSRRRNDDDDNETEVFDDDDIESLAGGTTEGMQNLKLRGAEDEKELPAHACAYVSIPFSRRSSAISVHRRLELTELADIVEFIHPAVW